MLTVRCSIRLLGGVWPGGCLPRGVCLPMGVSAQGGVCPGGGCLPDTHPVNRMTDACENITLPQLRCGR